MSTPQQARKDLIATLAWLVEMGADEAIGDSFLDRTERPAELPSKARAFAAPAKRGASPPPKVGAALVGADPQDAPDLDALRERLAAFPHPLREGARNCVFADGNPAARVMIVGEAPGRDEDLQGLPFVGRSGQLLDRMLACIGLDRASPDPGSAVYITNVLPWRPVGNRTPSIEEATAFLGFTQRHIALADPEIVIPMGNASTKALLATSTGIMRMRGRWTEAELGGRVRPVLPMLHPAYLLRQPAEKKRAWEDLLRLEARLKGETP